MNILITGGCGFIGCNTALRLLNLGHTVCLFDDLSRVGTDRNLTWLQEQGNVQFVQGDLRDAEKIAGIVQESQFDAIIHLAAQVAVTSSVLDPRHDFEVNALGTFNLLEAVRLHSPSSAVLYASTNKVYGKLESLKVGEEANRHFLVELPSGVPETWPLDFHSPYGCSKGAADQYMADYARIYNLRTVTLRQSCIYGYRQFGVEDQGWVAWFTIAHMLERPITIYGTGKQVRDVLFIDDLIDCYVAVIERIDRVAGMTFNIGGGPENSLSLLELLQMLGERFNRPVKHTFSDWRPGDQPVYISDISRAQALLDWTPRVSVSEGITRLSDWISSNRALFEGSTGRL